MFGYAVLPGILAAMFLSMILGLARSRAIRFETELDISALAGIQAFLRGTMSGPGWSQESLDRLCAAAEETFSSMLELRDDHDKDRIPRLVVVARPAADAVEIEFFSIFSEENIEDRIAFLSEQAEEPEISELSFRLLRHHASSVRHRKYHGIDIVTVRVEAYPSPRSSAGAGYGT